MGQHKTFPLMVLYARGCSYPKHAITPQRCQPTRCLCPNHLVGTMDIAPSTHARVGYPEFKEKKFPDISLMNFQNSRIIILTYFEVGTIFGRNCHVNQLLFIRMGKVHIFKLIN